MKLTKPTERMPVHSMPEQRGVMKMRKPFARIAAVVAGLAMVLPIHFTGAAMFDLDTGTVVPSLYSSVPFVEQSGGITATFSSHLKGSSAEAHAFSVQTATTSMLTLSLFSGQFLMANDTNPDVLEIRFNQPITSVTLDFATTDAHQTEATTPFELAAYQNTTPVGTATTSGTYGADSFPMGTLAFASITPFNRIELSTVSGPNTVNAFLVDNINVTAAVVPSVPDTGSTLLLLSLAGTALAGLRRRLS